MMSVRCCWLVGHLEHVLVLHRVGGGGGTVHDCRSLCIPIVSLPAHWIEVWFKVHR